MRRISLLLLVAASSVIFVSCKKDAKCPYTDSTVVAPQAERDSIARYLAANNITAAVQHSSGLYYTIGTAGTGANPDVCSDVSVQYEGFLFSGFKFDGTVGSNTARFTLGQTIEGWKKGIPLLKAGGTITLYVPPSLGYGNRDVANNANVVIIPANSYLRFTVSLLEVQ